MTVVAASINATAAPQYILNGKVVDVATASIAAQDSKNTVLQCEHVVSKVNAKGTIQLKKAESAGDWQPLNKK